MCYHWLDNATSHNAAKDEAWGIWWWDRGNVRKSRDMAPAEYRRLCESERAAFEKHWSEQTKQDNT